MQLIRAELGFNHHSTAKMQLPQVQICIVKLFHGTWRKDSENARICMMKKTHRLLGQNASDMFHAGKI